MDIKHDYQYGITTDEVDTQENVSAEDTYSEPGVRDEQFGLTGEHGKHVKKYRLKINQRERMRMHDLNAALDSLREVMPYANGPSVRKLSKIATMLLAKNYILMLQSSLEDMKKLVADVYGTKKVGTQNQTTTQNLTGDVLPYQTGTPLKSLYQGSPWQAPYLTPRSTTTTRLGKSSHNKYLASSSPSTSPAVPLYYSLGHLSTGEGEYSLNVTHDVPVSSFVHAPLARHAPPEIRTHQSLLHRRTPHETPGMVPISLPPSPLRSVVQTPTKETVYIHHSLSPLSTTCHKDKAIYHNHYISTGSMAYAGQPVEPRTYPL